MVPKSKLILIMAELSVRKKERCALALLVMLDKVENEDTSRRFSFRRLVKAFFVASPVSKPISFATASQAFFF